jgi:Flp pilus assembly pilin Flp
MLNFKIKSIKEEKGVTVVEYAVLAGLIGTLSVGVLLYMGTSVSDTFVIADNSLVSARALSQVPTTGAGEDIGEEGPGAGVECYVETSTEENIVTFGPTDPYSCFFTSNGEDYITIEKDGPIEVTADGGLKRIEITGSGDHTLNLNSVDPTSNFDIDGGTITSSESGGFITARSAIDFRSLSSVNTPTSGFSFNLSDEDDTIEMVGQSYQDGDLGGGNDVLRISGIDSAKDGYGIDLGGGNDTVDLNCVGDNTGVDNSTNYPFSFKNSNVSSTSATVSKCSTFWEYRNSNDIQNFDLTQTQASNTVALDKRTPYTSISASGAYSGSVDFRIDSLSTIQQGPVNLDFNVNNDYQVFGNQSVKVHVAPDRMQEFPGSNESSSFPVNVRINTNDAATAGSTVVSDVRLDFASGSSSIEYSGNAAGPKRMFLGFGNPVDYPNQGVAGLTSSFPVTLNISMQGGCWPVTVHAKPFSGFSDVSSTGAGCSYTNINNGTVFNNLSSYEGVSMTAPNGDIIQFGFNGGAFKNGSTLSVGSLTFSQYDSYFW